MRKNMMTGLFGGLLLAAFPLAADTQVFKGIIGDAAVIQRDAEEISKHLKSKSADYSEVKTKIETLGKDIAALRKDVQEFDAAHPGLSEQQKKDWELVKTKSELLLIFYDQKAKLVESGDIKKNRSMLRAHANGIAKRAAMLQQTASRLDR